MNCKQEKAFPVAERFRQESLLTTQTATDLRGICGNDRLKKCWKANETEQKRTQTNGKNHKKFQIPVEYNRYNVWVLKQDLPQGTTIKDVYEAVNKARENDLKDEEDTENIKSVNTIKIGPIINPKTSVFLVKTLT